MSDEQVGITIMANAAEIQKSIEDTCKAWSRASAKDRMLVASACPKALFAELEHQTAEATKRAKDEVVKESACKAKPKKPKTEGGAPTVKSKEAVIIMRPASKCVKGNLVRSKNGEV